MLIIYTFFYQFRKDTYKQSARANKTQHGEEDER